MQEHEKTGHQEREKDNTQRQCKHKEKLSRYNNTKSKKFFKIKIISGEIEDPYKIIKGITHLEGIKAKNVHIHKKALKI